VRSDDGEVRQLGWQTLVSAYWKPAYKYLRLRWRADGELARDWTQEFFAHAIEKGFFDRFDPQRARFRTFLRVCLDGFAAKQREAQGREKRGGTSRVLSLDFDGAEGELAGQEPIAPDEVEDYFQREWMRSLFELALQDLRAECARSLDFEMLQRYDIEAVERGTPLTYAQLAEEFGVSVTLVTNRLHATRAKLRVCLLRRLRELCATDEEFRAEARALLGKDAR
jgi:RNA polymerase sigma factor (sigma-70 family)